MRGRARAKEKQCEKIVACRTSEQHTLQNVHVQMSRPLFANVNGDAGSQTNYLVIERAIRYAMLLLCVRR